MQNNAINLTRNKIFESNKILLDLRSRAVDERNKLLKSKQDEIQNKPKNQTGKGKVRRENTLLTFSPVFYS